MQTEIIEQDQQLKMISKSSIVNIINNGIPELWNCLLPEEKRIVSENLTILHYKKGQIIYVEGEEPDNLWILLKGKVKKYKSGIGDRVQILRLYRPVQYFGHRAYFAKENYVSSTAAFESSTLGTIRMEIVENLIRNNNDLAMYFIHDLSKTLGGSDTKIVNLTQKHIRGRLAEALLLLAENYGLEEDNATLKIYMSREDLANLSNMTTSNAIRTLSTFVNEKLILVDGRRIKIINGPMLKKISKFG